MSSSGMFYSPEAKPQPVVEPGEFQFASVALNHGHIYGMTSGLQSAGATCKWVYDEDPAKVAAFKEQFPEAQVADSLDQILEDPTINLVAAADITNRRADLGIQIMEAGKDYFTDKAPMTTLDQLHRVRVSVAATQRKYAVYYSERIHVESAVLAGQLIRDGAIGKVLQVLNLGPHRLDPQSRPEWFFRKEAYGGILCDIGSHNCEQILYFTQAEDAQVVNASVGNFNNPDYPELEDFGDANLVCDNGATGYFRVDWFTPDGLSNWGDGRSFILGTDGYIELRKYVNITRDDGIDNVYLVNGDGEFHIDAKGQVGYPFFGQLILDVLNRAETAMTQEHALKAAELSLQAQNQARWLTGEQNKV